MKKNPSVTIIEVGPRDGLQNESQFVPTKDKIALVDALTDSGLKYIEVTSFVSKNAIPQLSDAEEVLKKIHRQANVNYSVLVPNELGMTKAISSKIKNIAIFTAASETFNFRNINCSIADSIERFKPVMQLAKKHNIRVRGYISCVLGCPYEGQILPKQVIKVIEKLLAIGVEEISLGDTIGVGTPKQTQELLKEVTNICNLNQIAMHFHDTYGQAIANIYSSLELGISHFDSSVAGLGGCPYARGASGNVATEDVLYLMHGLGIDTNVDIYKVVLAGDAICRKLKRHNQSKVANALLANYDKNF